MTLEYIAFANIDAATFSVLVQTKMLYTAAFFRTVLGKKLMKKQLISLVLLTVGVMLCNMKVGGKDDGNELDDDARERIIEEDCRKLYHYGFNSMRKIGQ